MIQQISSFVLGIALLASTTLAQDQAKYAGIFKDDRITVELKQAPNGYSGQIRMGQTAFPATARQSGMALQGSFQADANTFEFTATINGDQMNLSTGGANYALKRVVAANPLSANPLGGNPLAGAATPPAKPQAAQLKEQVSQILAAANDANLFTSRLNQLRLPNHEQWFAQTFGPETGSRLAKEYGQLLGSFESDLQGVFGKMVKDGQTEVDVQVIERPDDPDATGLQRDALKAMIRPQPLFSAELKKPGAESGMQFRSFVYVDGAFRLVGRMRAVNATGGSSPVRPPTPPAATTPPVANPATPAATAAPASTASPAGAGILRFKRLHVKDDLIGMEAFTMLIPSDWNAQGGVVWRRHPTLPAAAAMRVTSPDGRSQFEILPQMPFVDGAREAAMESARIAGPVAVNAVAQRFADGSLYFGNELRRQVTNPAAFIRQFVLPRCRNDIAGIRITADEDMPQVAEAVAGGQANEPGIRKTVRAGRTRIEFAQGGQLYEEDIYCVLVFNEIAQIRSTFWGTEHLFAFRAPKGTMDGQIKILRTMTDSFRIDLNWFNKYAQLVATLVQGQLQEIRAIGEFSRRWAQMSDQISTERMKAWEDRQASYDRMNQRYSQYQRGVDEYRDASGGHVELPAGYSHAWISRGDEYVVTDNPNFNPNVELRGNWTPLTKVP